MTPTSEYPLLQKPMDQPSSMTFSIEGSWIGKTVTVITRLYENEPLGSISFDLRSDNAQLFQHEAWVNRNAIPGAIFGILSLLFIGLCIVQLTTEKKGYSILFLAVASLLQMFTYMSLLNENPLTFIDTTDVRVVYFLFPLLYIGTKMKVMKKRYMIWTIIVYSIYFILYTSVYVLQLPLPYWFDKVDILCFLNLGIMLYYCFKEYKTNVFLRHLLSTLGMFCIGYVLLFFITTWINKPLHEFIIILFKEAQNLYCRPLLFWIFNTILFILFILATWDLLQDRIHTVRQVARMESEQAFHQLQIETATNQLHTLRASQEQTMIYRHDMRHHLSLLYDYANKGDVQKIKEYLTQAKSDIDALTPIRYCEHETLNLLLASLASKAHNAGVTLSVDARISTSLPIDDNELCALLSNVIENAIQGAASNSDTTKRNVHFQFLEKDGKLLISTKNEYEGKLEKDGVTFVSKKKEVGHGFGIKSMITIIERHDGMYSIETNDGEFVLRIMIPMISNACDKRSTIAG